MANTVIVCPHCAKQYTVAETALGRKTTCKVCGGKFVVGGASTGQQVASASTPAPAAPTPKEADAAKERPRGADGIPLDWEPGDVILDLYEVVKLPGTKHGYAEGGMGRVNLVRHREWRKDLAVKSVLPAKSASARDVENFKTEAEQWVDTIGLHPNIVACHYVRVLGGVPRVFIEYVDGGSLQEWIASKQLYEGGPRAALERILDVAIQTAWGLHYVHELGLIHQDVKPLNVMMTADGVAKVTDFGLAGARSVAFEENEQRSEAETILATWGGMTPAYCSPEQAEIAGKKAAGTPREQWPKLTRRTDVWSWAVSVLHMFLGEIAWPGGQVAHLGLQRGPDEPHLPPMPPTVKELLQTCFQRRPEDRPHDLMQVADTLQTIYQQETGQPYPREAPKPAESLADTFNNRAVSLLDLGQPKEAKRCWEAALRAEAHHPASIFNAGLLAWRSAEIHDDRLLTGLRDLVNSRPNDWQPIYYLACVQLEQGDGNAALTELDRLSPEGKNHPEVQTLLAAAQRRAGGASKELRTLEGFHRNAVKAVSLSPDGKHLVSGGGGSIFTLGYGLKSGCEIKLWDVATGKCLQTLMGHSSSVYSVCLSPDARRALSGGDDKTLRLWDLQTGQCLRTWEGHEGPVWACALTKNGRYALSAGLDATLRVWDVASGSCVHALHGSHDQMRSLCLSPDNKYAAVGNWDGAISLWDLAKGEVTQTLKGHAKAVVSVIFSKDGRHVFSGSFDKTLCQWEVAGGRCLRTFAGHTGDVNAVCLSSDGRFAVSGSKDRTLRLWEVSTGRCLRLFGVEAIGYEEINAVVMSPDGKDVFFGGGSYDTTVGQHIKVLEVNCHMGFPPAAFAVCRATSGETALTTERAFQDLLGRAVTASAQGQPGTAARLIRQARSLQGFQRSPKALVAWTDLYLRLPHAGLALAWEARPFPDRSGQVAALALSGDGRQLLLNYEGEEGGKFNASQELWRRTGGRTGKFTQGLELLDLGEGGQARTFPGHDTDVLAVGLSADGCLALSGCKDGQIKCWDVTSGRCRWSAEQLVGAATSFALSRDGRWALVGGQGIEPSRKLPESDEGEVIHVSWDEDYFFHNRSGTLGLLDLHRGTLLRTLEGHRSPVTAVTLSPDERLAFSASYDKTVRVWDLATGKSLRTLEAHPGAVLALSVSEDGRSMLAGCCPELDDSFHETSTNNLLLWDVRTGTLLDTLPGHCEGTTAVSFSADSRHAMSGGHDESVRIWNVAKRRCVRVFENLGARILTVALSPDGRHAFAGIYKHWGTEYQTLKMWALDWELEEKVIADWDEAAQPYLEAFLTRQTPYVAPLPQDRIPTEAELTRALTRQGKPSCSDEDFQQLLYTLGCAGYGWLRPEGVRRELEKMAATWQGPPPLVP